MKKTGIFICIAALVINCINVFAYEQIFSVESYDLTGKSHGEKEVYVRDFSAIDSEGELLIEEYDSPHLDVDEDILSNSKEDEYFMILDMKVDSEENPYPEIEQTQVGIRLSLSGGGGQQILGKDFRLIYFDNENDEVQDLSENIVEESKDEIIISVEKLGKYILYYNPAAYKFVFYSDMPTASDEGWIKPEIYMEIDNLVSNDIIDFPALPEKEGYVFTGWKAFIGSGIIFIQPQPIMANGYAEVYASWCPEEEYHPIEISISSDETIIKGKEDGKKIRLTTNYGVFVSSGSLPSEWREEYEAEESEEYKKVILEDWKSNWNIVGAGDILIEKVERIDDKTVEFTLSGNSGNIYSSSNINIEFNSNLLLDEAGEEEVKVQLDEDGVKRQMYISDNTIKLSAQKRPGGGGSLNPVQFTVKFDTDGGSTVESQTVSNNSKISEPQPPEKEGYVFAGWFEDKELSKEYKFNTGVLKNMTLYAKWEEDKSEDNHNPQDLDDQDDIKKSQIIFTINQNDALVFGNEKTSDVPPVIREDRAFLPARFVAENLGASVRWEEETKTVTISKEEIEIVIVIGSDTAVVNGESVQLDVPAFIENDRTYTPIRFISEKLGASVEWTPGTQDIIITK